MFKSKKQKVAEKEAKKAAAAKKPIINKVKRPAPAAPTAKPIDVNTATPVKAAPKGELVKIHMLGNAMIGSAQYESGKEYTVSMRTYKQIGTSCVSMAKWRSMQQKGGLGNLRQ